MRKKIIILVIFLILIGIGIGTWVDYRQEVKSCKEQCRYITPADSDAYWRYEKKKLETQDQCIDYCLTVK